MRNGQIPNKTEICSYCRLARPVCEQHHTLLHPGPCLTIAISKKAVLPLAKILVTASCRSSKQGPDCVVVFTLQMILTRNISMLLSEKGTNWSNCNLKYCLTSSWIPIIRQDSLTAVLSLQCESTCLERELVYIELIPQQERCLYTDIHDSHVW